MKHKSFEIECNRFIAIDLGAETGRLIVGTLASNRLQMEEIYRFRTEGTRFHGYLRWNVIRIWEEILIGLKKVQEKYGPEFTGIGLDTWGVSLVGLDEAKDLAFIPFHYRAELVSDEILNEMIQAIGREEIVNTTGIQFMVLNSSTHLYGMKKAFPALSHRIKTLFLISDYFYFLLTGYIQSEYTNASTTQLMNAYTRTWAASLIEKLGYDPHIFPSIVMPGQKLGTITADIQHYTGLNAISVYTVATHDTASAIAAIPHIDPDISWAFLSSGTWSLLGIEISNPIINNLTKKYNFTNEGGVDSTIRLLKNIMGLWLLQECKREWAREGQELNYDQMVDLSRSIEAFKYLIYPDDNRFFSPNSMISAIQSFCSETGQPIPQSIGEITRCIFDSLACRYREVIKILEKIIDHPISQLHIVGGGSKNQFLCQLTADMLGIEVITGPMEATAIGNLLIQAKSTGLIKNLQHLRQIVADSFLITPYYPQKEQYQIMQAGYSKYLKFFSRSHYFFRI